MLEMVCSVKVGEWEMVPAGQGRGLWAGEAVASEATVGYNLRLVLAWLRILLRLFLIALCRPLAIPPTIKAAC